MLKRLELSGFKSFAKKTALDLSHKVTAVVGPNGSGKSNIAEGIRFVLGEQSIKSLRGKLGADLIFKGSKTHGAMGRASVSIVFDNSKRAFGKARQGEGNINLDFDEISISREVYGDGENRYLVNGSQVRLKDILEILAPLNIGSSGHHIISQGEADKILNSSITERKEMIEDALGLRTYQYKIFESERKLEKTNEHIKEAESLRRELAPHITFLKKQVEKIEKALSMREELKSLYMEYFSREEHRLKEEKTELEKERAVQKELSKIDETLAALKLELSLTPEDSASEESARRAEEALLEIRAKKDELGRKIGRLEGMIEIEEERSKELALEGGSLNAAVDFSEVESLGGKLLSLAGEALAKRDLGLFEKALREIVGAVESFLSGKRRESAEQRERRGGMGIVKLKESRDSLSKELSGVLSEEKELARELESSRRSLEESKENFRDKERTFFELSSKRSDISARVGMFRMRDEKFRAEEDDFNREKKEAEALVGITEKDYRHMGVESGGASQEERRRAIERIKVRLEDAGVGSGEDVIKEYEATSARDLFLATELEDLKKSKDSLTALIEELREKLKEEFKEGISKINSQFSEFFKQMFGGGTAGLSFAKREKRHYSTGDEEEEKLFDDEEKEFEEGIDIHVSLPQKKIRDLNMLSGGERALTSIALLFAISQVNPPPFLVLDETDAALDEANSRKYGDMLENLSKFSSLIVITHNRETMSRANVLYGVTMGADSASKILSVKFDEASAYAK